MPRKAPPPSSHTDPESDPAPILTDTAIVPVAPRQDGWTHQRQREFIEVLADTGCVTTAAQAVGMTTTSAYRLRRRADARAFDAAWEAALERAMQRLVPTAIDRALNGTVRPRYYHGELIGEERVYSERLLLRLLAKGSDMLAHGRARRAIGDDWDGAMAGIEAGNPLPPEPVDPPFPWEKGAEEEHDDESGPHYLYELYKPDGRWITNAPPPPDFDPSLKLTARHFEDWRYCVGEELVAIASFEAEEEAESEEDRRRTFGLDKNGRFPWPGEAGAAAAEGPERDG